MTQKSYWKINLSDTGESITDTENFSPWNLEFILQINEKRYFHGQTSDFSPLSCGKQVMVTNELNFYS